jgi:hypothetical protein
MSSISQQIRGGGAQTRFMALLFMCIWPDHIILPPHGTSEYPPKIYEPTRIMVTVAPLLSHLEWKVYELQPSRVAR